MFISKYDSDLCTITNGPKPATQFFLSKKLKRKKKLIIESSKYLVVTKICFVNKMKKIFMMLKNNFKAQIFAEQVKVNKRFKTNTYWINFLITDFL
ncbi:hypothetical protein BpHYR1_000384 [Brachionus plicatilis]|uniref:Uncharacterized protein n=1 Tax=Brachionus plicatilis TaxID=10195 RepID=A0A3M7Q555_BRAPC|nr:hypothetical protein BpHYR1_000384 [Brachionus plicatilis]